MTLATAARHSSATAEHYTPQRIIEAARATMGGIDLDPASCDAANGRVKSRAYFTKNADGGLGQDWFGNVFLNPPGGRTDGKSNQKAWWFKLAREFAMGHVEQAVFIGFSIEILQTTQVDTPEGLLLPLEANALCFPSRRIAYIREDGQVGASPPHASVIVYLGKWSDTFRQLFSPIGKCIYGTCI